MKKHSNILKIVLVLVIMILGSFSFVGCSTNSPAVVQFTINAVSSNSSFGYVCGTGVYESDENATLTATANEGYYFKQWNDGNTTNPRTIQIASNLTYTATFEEGDLVRVNNHNVIVKNGTATYIEGDSSVEIVAKNPKAFGYWYTTNITQPVYTYSTKFISVSLITSDVTYTAYDSACGFGFYTLISSDAVTSLNNLNVTTKDQLDNNQSLFTDVGMVTPSVKINATLTSEVLYKGVYIHAYSFTLDYDYSYFTFFRFYQISGNSIVYASQGSTNITLQGFTISRVDFQFLNDYYSSTINFAN